MTAAGGLRFVLASASPARRGLLEAAGIRPEVVVSGVDESTVDDTDPVVLCATLARRKAWAVSTAIQVDGSRRTVVLGCDSVLALGGQVLGKPADPAEATARWRQMRGRYGVLHTGHCLIDPASGASAEAVARTGVLFAAVSDAEIDAYVRTGEPTQVAGGFTIDGLGGWFVDRIDGDHGTVVGLSLPALRGLLAELGVPVWSCWQMDDGRWPPGG
jgi:nucleoside triphosphate pyrophosphatase